MELDFKGTWRTRSREIANINYYHHNRWWGSIGDTDYCWDNSGEIDQITCIVENARDYDLMERISERWSSERSGGENG